MNTSLARSHLTRNRDTAIRDVRDQAAAILAAVGTTKLRRIAFFRATKWANASARLRNRDPRIVERARASEWLRIGWALSLSPTPRPVHTSTC